MTFDRPDQSQEGEVEEGAATIPVDGEAEQEPDPGAGTHPEAEPER
jgi:hypothetical protein